MQNPGTASRHFANAQNLFLSGDLGGAINSAELASKLAPDNFEYSYLCGKFFNAAKLYENAIPYLVRSVGLMSRAAASQFELANAYFQLGMVSKSVPHFRNALKLNPPEKLKTNIRDYLSQALRDTGNTSEAIAILKRLASERSDFTPHALLSLVELENPMPDSDLARQVDSLRTQQENSPYGQRLLWLATGRCLLNAGQHAAAFEAWEKAAEAGKQENWSPKNHSWFLQSTRAFYDAELMDQCAPFAHESTAPVFVAGMPRSGTTLVEKLIAAHSMAGGIGELTRWQGLDRAFRREFGGPGGKDMLLSRVASGELQQRGAELLHLFETILGGPKARIVEKWPQNYLNAGFQALLFRNAKFMHMRRHPADIFISTFQNNFAVTDAFALDQQEFAREYALHENLMDHWKSLFGDRILTVEYEALVSSPEFEAQRIIQFVGLPWEDQCLRFYEQKSTVRTFSNQQVRRPINTSSVNRWRVYEPFLGPLFKTMDEMGLKYPPTN